MNIFKKHESNPLLGSAELGTIFDVYVTEEDGRYRMDCSWRKKGSCAVSFSSDGIKWTYPVITLAPRPESGWEDGINRNCVLKIDGKYKMWYTGQARGHSYIGYAESDDGINFTRPSMDPIMVSEYPWEGESVMNPCVLFEDGVYRMWYSAGETYEPNVLAYATSADGIHWKKALFNPIFVCEPDNYYEKERIGGCQIIKTPDLGYLMFYIGYENIDTARICVARSDNGVTGFVRCKNNPLVSPDKDAWDSEACYKPSVIRNTKTGKWMIWYNGRTADREYIGLAECDDDKLFR